MRKFVITAIAVLSLGILSFHVLPALAQAQGQTQDETLDDLLAKVATQVPAFGGMFVGEDGTLQVYLLDPGQAVAAVDAITAVFGPNEYHPHKLVHILEGQFSFLQLRDWYDKAQSLVMAVPEVSMLDIDEARNRLVIGVEKKEAASVVEKVLFKMAIPLEAVIIEDIGPILPYTLRTSDWSTGGLQIHSAAGWYCTLGFNAIDSSGRAGFVTNSHCTNPAGVADGVTGGTVFGQPLLPPAGSRVGVELNDPPLLSCLISGVIRPCRRSDAAFVQYDDPWRAFAVGYISRPTAQTTSLALPILAIDSTNPLFRITRKVHSTLAGTTLHKVGRTTGWTSGTVSSTCILTRQSGGPWLTCQSLVRALSNSGDSGSPVFARVGTGDATLHGILWGGTRTGTEFVFSPFAMLQLELGRLTVCAPGFGC